MQRKTARRRHRTCQRKRDRFRFNALLRHLVGEGRARPDLAVQRDGGRLRARRGRASCRRRATQEAQVRTAQARRQAGHRLRQVQDRPHRPRGPRGRAPAASAAAGWSTWATRPPSASRSSPPRSSSRSTAATSTSVPGAATPTPREATPSP